MDAETFKHDVQELALLYVEGGDAAVQPRFEAIVKERRLVKWEAGMLATETLLCVRGLGRFALREE